MSFHIVNSVVKYALILSIVFGLMKPLHPSDEWTIIKCQQTMLKNSLLIVEEKHQLNEALATALNAQAIFDTHVYVMPRYENKSHRNLGMRYEVSEFKSKISHLFYFGAELAPYVILREINAEEDRYQLREQGVSFQVPLLKMGMDKLKSDAARLAVRSAYYTYLSRIEKAIYETHLLFLDLQYESEKLNQMSRQHSRYKQLVDQMASLVSKRKVTKHDYKKARSYKFEQNIRNTEQKKRVKVAERALFNNMETVRSESEDLTLVKNHWQLSLERNNNPMIPVILSQKSEYIALNLAKEGLEKHKKAIQLSQQPDIQLMALLGYQFQSKNDGDWQSDMNTSISFEIDVNTDRKYEKSQKVSVDGYQEFLDKKLKSLTVQFENNRDYFNQHLELTKRQQKELKSWMDHLDAQLKSQRREMAKGNVKWNEVKETHEKLQKAHLKKVSLEYEFLKTVTQLRHLAGDYFTRIPQRIKEMPQATLLNTHTIDM